MERVSGLYARVCVNLAIKSLSLSEVYQDVLSLEVLLQRTKHVFAGTGLFNKRKLHEFYTTLIQYGKFHKTTVDVLHLMRDYNHFVHMEGFVRNFIKIYRKVTGIVEAKIVVAEKSDKKFVKQITGVLVEKFKHQVLLKEVVNPEVLGGMRIEVASYVIDATIANKLRCLKLEIIK